MVDGTKVRLQDHGKSLGQTELRWAWASEGVGKLFEIVGFWVNQDWKTISRDLSRRLDYGRLRMLFSDGGAGIEDNPRAARMDCQRCVWHGHHDFRFLLYADEVKGKDQKEFLELLNRNPLVHLRQAELETLTPADGPKVRKWTAAIRNGFAELLKALPETRYPKTRTYLLNFAQQALAFIDYWLDHQQWIPCHHVTSGQALTFDTIWARIKEHEGETFHQIYGGEFTYTVSGSAIMPNRTNQNIPLVHFEEAAKMLPLDNTVPVQHLRGPSYIFAVLMDRRIRKSDW